MPVKFGAVLIVPVMVRSVGGVQIAIKLVSRLCLLFMV